MGTLKNLAAAVGVLATLYGPAHAQEKDLFSQFSDVYKQTPTIEEKCESRGNAVSDYVSNFNLRNSRKNLTTFRDGILDLALFDNKVDITGYKEKFKDDFKNQTKYVQEFNERLGECGIQLELGLVKLGRTPYIQEMKLDKKGAGPIFYEIKSGHNI